MTRDQIDVMWNQALQQSVKDGEQFTRYHFAAMVAAAEREACAKVCDESAVNKKLSNHRRCDADRLANAIRARGQT